MKLLSDIDKYFSLVIQQEREMHSVSVSDPFEIVDALQVNYYQGNSKGAYNGRYCHFKRSKGESYAPKVDNHVCTHYGRTNHTIDTCYIKHKFPFCYKPNEKNQSYSQGISDMYFVGQRIIVQNSCIFYSLIAS